MTEWALKRFWTEVTINQEDDVTFSVHLDGRSIKTPAKRTLVLPNVMIAERIREEWRAQEEKIDPLTMPWTRSANAALDKVSVQRDEVKDHLIEYAGSDLLCYRADGPVGLIAKQAEFWDPILAWAAQNYEADLRITSGVMPVQQSAAAIKKLRKPMEQMNDFQLAAFHDLVTVSGSYVIALAAIEKRWLPDELWSAAMVDEEWQIEQWGADEEAAQMSDAKRLAFTHAAELYRLS